jgi:hypothetical protein
MNVKRASLTTRTDAAGQPLVGVTYYNVPIDLADVELLAHIPKIRLLAFKGSILTESVCIRLGELTTLEQLYFEGVRGMSSEGIKAIGKLNKLQHLSLAGTHVSDNDLGNLENYPCIESITLDSTSVGESGLSAVARMTTLREVSLRFTSIRDEDLCHLSSLKQLRGLQLKGTLVTDKAIECLLKYPQIADIDIRKTRITPEGADALRRTLPGASIAY